MMTINDIKNIPEFKEAAEVEYFFTLNNEVSYHTDQLIYLDDQYYIDPNKETDTPVLDYELMTEEEYDRTILGNACISADFADWYGDKNAKVLCVLLYTPKQEAEDEEE